MCAPQKLMVYPFYDIDPMVVHINKVCMMYKYSHMWSDLQKQDIISAATI